MHPTSQYTQGKEGAVAAVAAWSHLRKGVYCDTSAPLGDYS